MSAVPEEKANAPVQSPTQEIQLIELEKFEALVYARDYEKAIPELLTVLGRLRIGSLYRGHEFVDEAVRIYTTRLAGAITSLFADPSFFLSEEGYVQFCAQSGPLEAVYRVSGFQSPDFMMGLTSQDPTELDASKLRYATAPALAKMTLFLSLGSRIDFDFDQLFTKAAGLCLPLWAALLAHLVVLSPRAQERREMLYGLIGKFKAVQPVPAQAMAALSDAYMYSSYRAVERPHEVKRELNRMFRTSIELQVRSAIPTEEAIATRRAIAKARGGKPRMVIPMEWFNSFHAMFRCYAPLVAQLRERFHLIALARKDDMDAPARTYFDEVVEVPTTDVVFENLLNLMTEQQPDVIYYPSVGMNMHWAVLSTLRLAPIQVFTLGHPASTMSDEMDYAIMEEGACADPSLMSERMVLMPPGSMFGFLRRADTVIPEPVPRSPDDPVRIAVPAMVLKLNAPFLGCLQRISNAVKRPVEFVFFPNTLGVMHIYAKQQIQRWLPTAHIEPRLGYARYLELIGLCDAHFSTFPFGGTNSVVDSLMLGKPVLARDGPEPMERFEPLIFERMGLGDMVAKTTEEYEQKAIELIDNPDSLAVAAARIRERNWDEFFFGPRTGAASGAFGRAMWHLYENHESIVASGTREIRWQEYTHED